jgi:hypothetical protein
MAVNLLPSADDVTEYQELVGAVVATQVAPESRDSHIGLGDATATNVVASAEQASPDQYIGVTVVGVHVVPESLEV